MADIINFNRRVWRGDASAVPEAREAYAQRPDQAFIKLLVTLYSFRADPRFAEELLLHRSKLLERAKKEIDQNFTGASVLERANLADMLSTYLEWMSRQPQLSPDERQESHLAASEVYLASIALTDELEWKHHTWSLLKLTGARLDLNENNRSSATWNLRRVAQRAPEIEDNNQRARVYAKLGFLLRKSGWYRLGFYWGVRACVVPRIPFNVRKKALSALLGIDR